MAIDINSLFSFNLICRWNDIIKDIITEKKSPAMIQRSITIKITELLKEIIKDETNSKYALTTRHFHFLSPDEKKLLTEKLKRIKLYSDFIYNFPLGKEKKRLEIFFSSLPDVDRQQVVHTLKQAEHFSELSLMQRLQVLRRLQVPRLFSYLEDEQTHNVIDTLNFKSSSRLLQKSKELQKIQTIIDAFIESLNPINTNYRT